MLKILQLFQRRQNPGSKASGFVFGKQEKLKKALVGVNDGRLS